jgi:hypothetical protein
VSDPNLAPSKRLKGRIARVRQLSERQRDALFDLFAKYYADVKRPKFLADLADKSHIILLHDAEDGSLQGFSTLKAYDTDLDGSRVKIVFTGDTVVDKPYWGQRDLQKLFTTFLGRAKITRPFGPVYWFLMTKGYRTYLTMAKNFFEFYPCHFATTPAFESRLITHLAKGTYPEEFDDRSGLIEYAESGGQVRHGVADITADLLDDPHIRFFYERNPRYAQGTELVCVGKVTWQVITHSFTKVIRKKLGLPIVPDRRAPARTEQREPVS